MAKKKASATAKRLFKYSLVDGRVDPLKVKEVTSLLKGMTDSDKLSIFQSYAQLIEIKISHETAHVETPFEATGRWATEIEKTIKDKFPEVNYVHFSINPDLIAGIKVKIADMVYENSLKAKLNSLRKVH